MWYSLKELAKLFNTTEKQIDKKIDLKKLETKVVLQNLRLTRVYNYDPQEVKPISSQSEVKKIEVLERGGVDKSEALPVIDKGGKRKSKRDCVVRKEKVESAPSVRGKKTNWCRALEQIIIANGYIATTDVMLAEIHKYKTSKSSNIKMRISNTLSVHDVFIKLSHRVYGLRDHIDKISDESYKKYNMDFQDNGEVINDFGVVESVERLIIENGYVASLWLIYETIFKGFQMDLKEQKKAMNTVLLKKKFVRVGPGMYGLTEHLDKIKGMDIIEQKRIYNHQRWVSAIEAIIKDNDYLASLDTICTSVYKYIPSKAKTNYDVVIKHLEDERFCKIGWSLYGLSAYRDKITEAAIKNKQKDKEEIVEDNFPQKLTWADTIERIIIENGYSATIQLICESYQKYKKTSSTNLINIVHPILIRSKRFTKIGAGEWGLTGHLDKIKK